jgi:hypothetical protein
MRVELSGAPEEARVVLAALSKAYLAAVEERERGPVRDRLAKLVEVDNVIRAQVKRYRDKKEAVVGSLMAPELNSLRTPQAWTEAYRATRSELMREMQARRAERGNLPLAWLAGQIRLAFWQAASKQLEERLNRIGCLEFELELSEQESRSAESMAVRFSAAIDEQRAELSAPPRITLVQEPQAQPVR